MSGGLPDDVTAALDVARRLAAAGVPVFVADSNPSYGLTDSDGVQDGRMFLEPHGWQRSPADPSVVDLWQPGMLLAAVTGVAADVIDTDPRNGGERSRELVDGRIPAVFGKVLTQSGGTHEWIGRLHRRKRTGSSAILPGLDVIAGDDDGAGRGYVRIPPTSTPSGAYAWTTLPDLGALKGGDQDSVQRFLRTVFDPLVAAQSEGAAVAGPYDGHPLTDRERRYLDAALLDECGQVSSAVPGTRNTRLNLAAYRLGAYIAGAGLDEAIVVDLLGEAATEAGLPPAESALTISSGVRAGRQRPRVVPGAAPMKTEGSDLVDLTDYVYGERTSVQPPAVLRRADGAYAFYRGRMNTVYGEPESAKSMISQATAVDELGQGGRTLLIDLEDHPSAVVERLLLLGATNEQICDQLDYSRPHSADQLRLRLGLASRDAYNLIIIDSLGEAMSMLGVESTSNDQVTQAIRRYMRPLAATGAAVLLIDHVTKSRESRGTYAIGAQAKKAIVDGAAYTVETLTPAGRERAGSYLLRLVKDRPGWIRGRIEEGNEFAVAVLDPDADRFFDLVVPSALTPAPDARSEVRRRIEIYLREQDEACSMNKIVTSVTGNNELKRELVGQMCDEGLIKKIQTGRYPEFVWSAGQG